MLFVWDEIFTFQNIINYKWILLNTRSILRQNIISLLPTLPFYIPERKCILSVFYMFIFTKLPQTPQLAFAGFCLNPVSPVASTMPSKMTTISKSSFSSWACDMSQKAECASISWEITSGETRKRRSSPVSKPTLMSVWFRGMNSPGDKQTKTGGEERTASKEMLAGSSNKNVPQKNAYV